MKRRREWFEKFDGMYVALWWVRAGHIPTVEEAKQKLEYLTRHGESREVFTFRKPFPPPDESPEDFVVTPFEPCPAL